MYEKILMTFISGAGGKIGSRIMELFDEQTKRQQRIEEKVDKIYDAILHLGLKQDLLFFTDRKKKILSDISIYKSYLKDSKIPTKENLSNISKLFTKTDPSSFVAQVNKFITDIIGVDLDDGIYMNSFSVNPEDFRKGVLFKFAGNLLCKTDIPIDEYLLRLAEFSALFIYDLQKLSEAYSLAYEVLKKSGLADSSEQQLDIEPRWCGGRDGLANDLMPLLTEYVRYVAGPAFFLSEASQNKWRVQPTSLIIKHNNWILENKSNSDVYTGYSAEDGTPPTFGLSSHNSLRLWYVQRAVDSKPDYISLGGGTDPSKVLKVSSNNTNSQLASPDTRRTAAQSFVPKVYKYNSTDTVQWFKLCGTSGDELAAGNQLMWDRVDIGLSNDLSKLFDDHKKRFTFVFWNDRLFPGDFIQADQSLFNIGNSKYQLKFDTQQGLVFYENGVLGRTIWRKPDSITIDKSWRVYVGLDALHIYPGSRHYVDTPPLVQSEDSLSRMSMLIVQDDGNVVLYEYKEDTRTAKAMNDEHHPIAVVLHS